MLNKENLRNAIKDMDITDKRFQFFKYDDNIINGKNAVDWYLNMATRSNGKTTALQRDVILSRLLKDEKTVIVKPLKENLKNQYNVSWWTDIVKKALRKWDIHIEYKTGVYYINEYEKFVDEENVFDKKNWFKSATKFAYVVPLMQQEQYKSVVETENVTSICYDEFARVNGTFSQEPEHMKSLISTVVRTTGHVQVFMNANIVQPHNPFLQEFNINAFDLREGNTYTFQADYENSNSAIIYVDFSRGVAKDSKDLPRVLQLKNNTQALGQDKFAKPLNVISKGDWLLNVLENNKDKFDDFYEFCDVVRYSVDDTKNLIKIGNEYQFDFVEFYIIYDKYNMRYYFIEIDDNTIYDEGLRLKVNKNFNKLKFNDGDIRNMLPIVKQSDYQPYIYGSIRLYNILRDTI